MAAALASKVEQVEVLPWCRWAWRAWHRLKDDRQWRGGGMGTPLPCGIPYTAVAAYADRRDQDADALYDLIQAMDAVYIAWWAERVEEEAAKNSDG